MKPDKPSLGRWNAYAASFSKIEDRRTALNEAPKELRTQIENHLKAIWAIKKYVAGRNK